MGPQKQSNKGVLLDVQTHEHEGKAVIDLYIRLRAGSPHEGQGDEPSLPPPAGIIHLMDREFPPYYYIRLTPSANPKTILSQLKEETLPGGIKPLRVELMEREEQPYIKISFSTIAELVRSREGVKNYPFTEALYEANIPYTKRYLLDKQLIPYTPTEWSLTPEGRLKTIRTIEGETPPLRTGSLDIETYGTHAAPIPEKDPIISIALNTPAGKKVFIAAAYENEFTQGCMNEKKVLEQTNTFLSLADLDVLYTYNGDRFDFPFLVERSHRNHVKMDYGFGDVQLVGKGNEREARIHGIQHVDVYQLMRLLARFQVFKSPRMDLESVMRAVFGRGEKSLTHKDIVETWKTQKGLDQLAKYNLTDTEYTQELGDEFLPSLLEIARLVHLPLFDVNRMTASQLVETTLMHESVKQGRMFPNSPNDDQVRARETNPIEGGYVKEPVAGLHENLAVLDFRSLHPSIMISHNISPDTLDCVHPPCKEGVNKSPTGHWFCTKKKGLFSVVLERILDARIAVQKKMDDTPKGDPQLVFLKGRKQALKIVLNSFFGTLAYPRFRWYSRESARAITAWSRHYIRQTLNWAEEAGYKTVYADTDSCFMIVRERTEQDVCAFVKQVNKRLPGRMELEFEGLYKRGLFVTKKEGHAAKKRYALADYENNLTIVGFEYVRRDVSIIARETQKRVLEEVLVKGNPERAHAIVLETIGRLKEGNVPKKELVILTQLQRRTDAYVTTAPHVAAAQKAQKRGKEILVGSMLGFIITAKGKTISDKAELEEFVKEGDYDAEYYIQNQVIPAVEKIFAELGIDSTDLERGGKQTGLGAFG